MKKLVDFVRKTLSMSPAEARGAVIIFGIMVLLIITPFLSDYFFSRQSATVPLATPQQLDSLTITLDKKPTYGVDNQSEGSSHFNRDDDNSEKMKTPIHYFPFNPNTASVQELQSLGIPAFLAKRIDKYRSKGGKFRKKEDLAKIYDFSPELYNRLASYISLASPENHTSYSLPSASLDNSQPTTSNLPTPSATSISPSVAHPAEINKFSTSKGKNPQKFDMNMADTTAFKNISGIGSGYAKRIVKFRESLGGFANAEQVKETFGLPPETAEELLKYGFVKTGVKKLKVNELAAEALKHPYLRFFQAKAIVAYREQHGAFKSAEDLKNIKVLDEATIEKLKPYLEF